MGKFVYILIDKAKIMENDVTYVTDDFSTIRNFLKEYDYAGFKNLEIDINPVRRFDKPLFCTNGYDIFVSYDISDGTRKTDRFLVKEMELGRFEYYDN